MTDNQRNKTSKVLILSMILLNDIEELQNDKILKFEAIGSGKKFAEALENMLDQTFGKAQKVIPKDYRDSSEAFSEMYKLIDESLNETFEIE